jgi:glutamine---fructose-6-phosphate transaminase (isomerizing)
LTATLRSITGQFPYWQKARLPDPITNRSRLHLVTGCGTSYNLALSVAAVMNGAGLRALAVPAGEWLARPGVYAPDQGTAVIALSRSGETTETVQAAAASRGRGLRVTGITCAPGSGLSRASDNAIEFATHPEEGIVMTASASLMLLAGYALAGITAPGIAGQATALLTAFDRVPVAVYAARRHFVFLGGGAQYGIALEGALKLQEMALCFTQTFHPGEYRHGPVSLLDSGTAVVMLYSTATAADEARLVVELQAKGAWVLGVGGPGDVSLPLAHHGPLAGAEVLPLLQMLGERYAAAKGIDTTAPRNLTKVVMLEA